MSKAEANDNMHFVLRLETPWKMGDGQIMEAGVQAYTGTYSPGESADDHEQTALRRLRARELQT
ncbi:MAG: hypothetical protein WCO90_10785 [Planctomycetota bacterium]